MIALIYCTSTALQPRKSSIKTRYRVRVSDVELGLGLGGPSQDRVYVSERVYDKKYMIDRVDCSTLPYAI